MKSNIWEFLSLPEKEQRYWLTQIARSDWRAAAYLRELLIQDQFRTQYGADAKLFLLTQERELLAFCTLSAKDDIKDETLYPWIGFVYTFPEHRGHRYSQRLIDHACSHARSQRCQRVYLTSNEIGLYEKYGFTFLETRSNIWGESTRLFVREL